MIDQIFREYDIRGIVGEQLHLDQMYALTKAIAYFFLEKQPQVTTVALAMDGRIHSEQLKSEAVRALQDSGLHVLFLGMCPTPTLYFSQFTMPVQAGLMITASHNPAQYNGIKIVLNQECVWGADLITIRDYFKKGYEITTKKRGSYQEIDGAQLYVDYLVHQFDHLKNMPLSIVVDCANAVGGIVMPRIIKALKWKNVRLLYEHIDGTYPHHEADPVVEKNMQDVKKILMTDSTLDFGIGLDGDCDRMSPMTKSGYLVPGDQLLALFSKDILQKYPGAAVVFDVKASSGLIDLLNQWGARACISACGHSIIKNQMKKYNAVIGGELSCHFCFKDRYFGYDDGIYAALRLCEIIVKSGATLDELISMFPRKCSSPEIRVACAEEQKEHIVNEVKKYFAARADTTVVTIDGVRATTPQGWGLVRASNTQSVLSFRFEGETPEKLQSVKNQFIEIVEPYFNKDFLRTQLNGDKAPCHNAT